MIQEPCYLCSQQLPETKEITDMAPKGCEHGNNAYCAFFLQQAGLSAIKYKMKNRRPLNDKPDEQTKL